MQVPLLVQEMGTVAFTSLVIAGVLFCMAYVTSRERGPLVAKLSLWLFAVLLCVTAQLFTRQFVSAFAFYSAAILGLGTGTWIGNGASRFPHHSQDAGGQPP